MTTRHNHRLIHSFSFFGRCSSKRNLSVFVHISLVCSFRWLIFMIMATWRGYISDLMFTQRSILHIYIYTHKQPIHAWCHNHEQFVQPNAVQNWDHLSHEIFITCHGKLVKKFKLFVAILQMCFQKQQVCNSNKNLHLHFFEFFELGKFEIHLYIASLSCQSWGISYCSFDKFDKLTCASVWPQKKTNIH